jgi:transposase
MKKYVVKLTDQERRTLRKLTTSGTSPARIITRARILLKSDQSQHEPWTDEQISQALEISVPTVMRVRQSYVEEGFETTIFHSAPNRPYQRKLDEEAEALLLVFLYTDPPNGRSRWTTRSLAEQLVKTGYVRDISHETIRQALKRNGLYL